MAELAANHQPIPGELRFGFFKQLLKSHGQRVEEARSPLINLLFEHDLGFLLYKLGTWENKEKVVLYRARIESFIQSIDRSTPMSLKMHAYNCFCLSALISGVPEEELAAEYDKQIHTMVKGVICPKGKWSVKTELENQSYCKYLFHVSGDGLVSVPLVNKMTATRIDDEDPDSEFVAARMVAVACDEDVGFDGIRNSLSILVLRHDFIHAGFLKYAIQHNAPQFWALLTKVGIIYEKFQSDPELTEQKKAQVEAAFFMWLHEYTTSIFVDGFPRKIPGPRFFLKGLHGSAPQIFLRLASKLHITPALFSNEISTEVDMLSSLGLEVTEIKSKQLSDHEKVKAINAILSPGYAYLKEKFGEYYGHRHRVEVVYNRIMGKQPE